MFNLTMTVSYIAIHGFPSQPLAVRCLEHCWNQGAIRWAGGTASILRSSKLRNRLTDQPKLKAPLGPYRSDLASGNSSLSPWSQMSEATLLTEWRKDFLINTRKWRILLMHNCRGLLFWMFSMRIVYSSLCWKILIFISSFFVQIRPELGRILYSIWIMVYYINWFHILITICSEKISAFTNGIVGKSISFSFKSTQFQYCPGVPIHTAWHGNSRLYAKCFYHHGWNESEKWKKN